MVGPNDLLVFDPMQSAKAFEMGVESGVNSRKRNALMSASSMAGRGDYAGGANVLMGVGEFQGAGALQGMGQQAQRVKGAQAYAAGNIPEAKTAYGAAGDIAPQMQMDEATAKRAGEFMDWMGRTNNAAKSVPLAQRPQFFQQQIMSAPDTLFDSAHSKQSMVQALKPEDMTDEALTAHVTQSMSVKDQLAQSNSDRTFGETVRSNKAREGNAYLSATKPPASSLPSLSKDYRYGPNGEAEPIPGTPAAQKIAVQQRKALSTVTQMEAASKDVNAAIDRALQLTDPQQGAFGTTGLVGGLAKNFGGNAARDLAAALNTISGNIGFDKLAEMRANSPTGGALGNVSERELELLASVVASLDQGQSDEQVRANLLRVREHYKRVIRDMRAAYDEDYGGQQSPAAPPAAPAKSGGTGVTFHYDAQGNRVQ
jgi:hypothetical protein